MTALAKKNRALPQVLRDQLEANAEARSTLGTSVLAQNKERLLFKEQCYLLAYVSEIAAWKRDQLDKKGAGRLPDPQGGSGISQEAADADNGDLDNDLTWAEMEAEAPPEDFEQSLRSPEMPPMPASPPPFREQPV